MSQTSYSLDNPIAVEGALYDVAMTRDKISALVELAAGIRTDITGGLIRGVSFIDLSLETPVGGAPLYAETDSIPLMRKGRIWVVAENTAVADQPVFVRFQNGDDSATFDGGFSGVNTIDHDLLPDAKWFKGAAAGELGVIEVNIP